MSQIPRCLIDTLLNKSSRREAINRASTRQLAVVVVVRVRTIAPSVSTKCDDDNANICDAIAVCECE